MLGNDVQCSRGVFFDRLIKRENERGVGKIVKLRDERSKGWEVKLLVYFDDYIGSGI